MLLATDPLLALTHDPLRRVPPSTACSSRACGRCRRCTLPSTEPRNVGPGVARFHATGELRRTVTVLEFPRRFVCRTRVAGGGACGYVFEAAPGDASRRVPAMRARGGPTATAGQEAAAARATGGTVRAPEREALRGPGRPAAVRDVRGRAATMTRRAPRTASSPASSRRHPGLRGSSSQARGRHGSDDAAAVGPATTVDEARTVALAQVIRPDHHMLAREPLIVFGSVAGAMGPGLTPRPPIAAGAPCPHSGPG